MEIVVFFYLLLFFFLNRLLTDKIKRYILIFLQKKNKNIEDYPIVNNIFFVKKTKNIKSLKSLLVDFVKLNYSNGIK